MDELVLLFFSIIRYFEGRGWHVIFEPIGFLFPLGLCFFVLGTRRTKLLKAFKNRTATLISGLFGFALVVFISITGLGERIGLLLCKSQFEQAIQRISLLDNQTAHGFGHDFVCIYDINGISKDERGGTYLALWHAPDMIDTFFYGFAFEPNSEGSPFGNAYYQTRKVSGSWHTFRSNNDW